MRKLLVVLIFASLLQHASAQRVSVKGKVTDTLENRMLSNAVVSLLQKKDSMLLSFSRTDKSGAFTIKNVLPGKYLLLITFPKFADFADDITVKEGSDLDIGSLPLTQRSLLLKEVVVNSRQAIRIKGDTTEFTADSFAVRDGATVEELLKKMPGFTVNSKGEITAQGKKVDKVLVDGEEFFGDDPTMATQNISAKAVDRVQVYDTKTEQQNLKGITSGDEGKTVNIKLKDDKKRGAFGKAEGGTDFNNLADVKLMYNNFVGKKKISLYATKSNVNTGSLNWQDRQKLGLEENDVEYDEIGGYYYSFGSNDEFNDWSLRGLPNSYSAGALYSNKWNADKQSLNGSYRFNRLETYNVTTVRTQNILPDTLFYTNQNTVTNGFNQQHAANFKYEWKIDSLASIKLSSAGIYKTSEAINTTYSESLGEDSAFVNTNNRTNDVNSTRKQTDNALTYKQLFKKKGRQLITVLRLGITDDEQNNMLNSSTEYFQSGNFDHKDTLDQLKLINGHSVTAGSKITYSEPLSPRWNLILEYSFNQNNANAHRNTFDKSTNNKYENLNTLYSNNFNVNAFANTGTTTFRYINKKLKFALGSGVSSVKLNLTDLDSAKKNSYNFLNLTPQFQLGYQLKQQTSFSFRYQGTTRQPTIDQLQPIRDNSDPLNVFVGNPALKVGFNHNLNLSYNSFKVLTGRYMYLGIGYNILERDITNTYTVDNFGKKTYMPVNVNGNQNWYIYSGFQHGQGEKKLTYGGNFYGNGGKNISFINGEKNSTDYASLQLGLRTGYTVNEKYSFDLHPEITYNYSNSSLRPDVKNRYFTYGGGMEGFTTLPGKLELNSDVNLNLRQKTVAFNNTINITTWNAALAKKVFKKKNGKFILMANDLLNQNRGIDRTINTNFISEQTYLRRSRYFMLRFEWSFNKMPDATK